MLLGGKSQMRLGTIGRGLAAGVLAGVAWWVVEAAVNRAEGGFLPFGVAWDLAVFELALGAIAGLAVAIVLLVARRGAGAAALALGLAAAYGLFRVYDPPGLGSEAVFALVATAAAAAGVLLAGAETGGVLAFVHLLLLTTVAVALGGFTVDETMGGMKWGPGLPFVLALVPVAAVAADRVVGLAVRSRAAR